MTIYDHIFRLGLGTNSFAISGVSDEEGIEKSAQMTIRAIESGVRYIDTSNSYSRGMAHTVLKRAFAITKQPYYVTLKSQFSTDKTSDALRKRAEASLMNMGISRAGCMMIWSIMSYGEFEAAMQKGGLYDGALKLKDEGIVEHITFSTHAPVPDIIKILQSGAFEGVTISYSPLNSVSMYPVLDAAKDLDIGIVAMNPLGGGIIPQNDDYFAFLKSEAEQSVAQAALRFVMAQPAVNIALSGVSSLAELEDNLTAVTSENLETDEARLKRVTVSLRELGGFCTGCDYCDGCPVGIPVSAIMMCRNSLLFKPLPSHNRHDPQFLYNIQFLGKLNMDFSFLPDTPENPCTHCGKCELRCTQSLNICDALEDTYSRADITGFSHSARRERLQSLLDGKSYKKVGFYPGGGYTAKVLQTYHELIGMPDFDCFLFDSNPLQWGSTENGREIHSPDKIADIKPDCIVVSNYKFGDEIYDSLSAYEKQGIKIVKLHYENDVPWLF